MTLGEIVLQNLAPDHRCGGSSRGNNKKQQATPAAVAAATATVATEATHSNSGIGGNGCSNNSEQLAVCLVGGLVVIVTGVPLARF